MPPMAPYLQAGNEYVNPVKPLHEVSAKMMYEKVKTKTIKAGESAK